MISIKEFMCVVMAWILSADLIAFSPVAPSKLADVMTPLVFIAAIWLRRYNRPTES
jgi:cytosine/uracil/thiamine/allantoin permease